MSRTYSEVFPDLLMAPPTSNVIIRASEVKVVTEEHFLTRTSALSLERLHEEMVRRKVQELTKDSTNVVAVRYAAREGLTTTKLTTRLYVFNSESHFNKAWDYYNKEIVSNTYNLPGFEPWIATKEKFDPHSETDEVCINIPDNSNLALISKGGVSIPVEISHLEHALKLHKERKER